MRNLLFRIPYFILLLVFTLNCGGGGGTQNTPVPPLSQEAFTAAQVLTKEFNIPTSARVIQFGPVEPGSFLVSPLTVAGLEAQLKVQSDTWLDNLRYKDIARLPETKYQKLPLEKGTYYVFFIDPAPDFRYEHRVYYAWVNVENGSMNTFEDVFPPIILQPNGKLLWIGDNYILGSSKVNGVNVIHMGDNRNSANTRENNMAILQDIPERFTRLPGSNPESGTTGGSEGQNEQGSAPSDQQSQQENEKKEQADRCPDPIKEAVVIDLGGGPEAEEIAYQADQVATYLMDNGFTIHRISNTASRNYERIYSGKKLCSYLIGKVLNIAEKSTNLNCPCNSLFIYIGSHGFSAYSATRSGLYKDLAPEDRYGVALYDTRGRLMSFLLYKQIYECIFDSVVIERDYSDVSRLNLKITVFIDACYSNGAQRIGDFENYRGLNMCSSLCGLTVMTAGPFAVPIKGATSAFVRGATVDLDGDGKVGDLKDRFLNMKNSVKQYKKNPNNKNFAPALFTCPGQDSLCVLD